MIYPADIHIFLYPPELIEDTCFCRKFNKFFMGSDSANDSIQYVIQTKKNFDDLKSETPEDSPSLLHPALSVQASSSQDSLWSLQIELYDLKSGQIKSQWIILNEPANNWPKYFSKIHQEIQKQIQEVKALEGIRNLENRASSFRIHLSSNKIQYRYGEFISITMESSQSCYITCFDIGTSGQIHQIFPNPHQPDHYIKANTAVTIKNIEVTLPAGFEMIKAIATKHPLDLDELSHLIQNNKQFTNYGNDLGQFSRGFQLSIQSMKDTDWAAATLLIEVVE